MRTKLLDEVNLVNIRIVPNNRLCAIKFKRSGMKPHPLFREFDIPRSYSLGGFHLKALSIHDLVRDHCAIMESAVDIKAANPSVSWPDGLTLEQNLLDLAWHQMEFEKKRSFAWVIEDRNGEYLGCLYVYPAMSGEHSAEVRWWWRTGATYDEGELRERLLVWFAGTDWPSLNYELMD